MKYTIFTIIFFAVSPLFGQDMCLNTSNFTIHPIMLKSQSSTSVRVKFDVVGRVAQNIEVFPTDSLSAKYFLFYESYTIDNIKQITFFNDKNKFSLLVNYEIRPARLLSNNFAEIVSDSILNIVFKAEGFIGQQEYVFGPPVSDSLTFTNYLPYKIGMSKKSDILVQRIFNNNEDSTIILKNNYPEYEKLIYEKSKEYTRESFVGFSENAKYFFIRFYILRRIEDCGFEEIL